MRREHQERTIVGGRKFYDNNIMSIRKKSLLPLLACFHSMYYVTAFLDPSRIDPSPSSKTKLFETKEDLKALANKLNPVIGFFDPLGLTNAALWGKGEEFTIGWLRQSEIKHGRVAMAAFVGYCVQSNFVFPWALSWDGTPHPSVNLSPPEQWDAIPLESKLQIILFIGFLEWFSELKNDDFNAHYTKGGQPGKFPPFRDGGIPHPVPFNLYDPFGLSKKLSADTKESKLVSELNNGRLAMLGIIGFLSEQKITGSVPILSGVVKPYAGEVMAPFEADFTLLF